VTLTVNCDFNIFHFIVTKLTKQICNSCQDHLLQSPWARWKHIHTRSCIFRKKVKSLQTLLRQCSRYNTVQVLQAIQNLLPQGSLKFLQSPVNPGVKIEMQTGTLIATVVTEMTLKVKNCFLKYSSH